MNPAAAVLKRMGLYRPSRRALRHISDPERRWRDREIRQDLRQTSRELAGWGATGGESADPARLFGIVGFTNLPLHAKFQAMVAKAAQLQGFTPVVFNKSGNRFAHRYFRLFGVDRLVMWDRELTKLPRDEGEVVAAVERLIGGQATVPGLMEASYRGVDVGKHALSMTCRRLLEGHLDLSDPHTDALLREQLTGAIRSTLAMERYMDRFPIERMLIRDPGYVPNGALFEAALGRGTDCIVYEQGERRGTWVLKRYGPHNKGEHYFSLSSETWDRVQAWPWTRADEALLDREFDLRYQPESTDDTRRLMSGKSEMTADEVRAEVGLDPAKKTAVIFSHMAWDAAFFFGRGLFEDFEDWLYRTVEFVAAECPDMNWIVKLHPANVFKLLRESKGEESEIGLLEPLMPLPGHVRLMRANTPVSTRSLFDVADFALTVNGTVGMEFPCFGKRAVVAGTGRYAGRGFTEDPPTVEAYFDSLRTLHRMPPLDAANRALARRHLLALLRCRQVDFESVAPMSLKASHAAKSNLHDNISISARSLKAFAEAEPVRLLSAWLDDGRDPDLMQPLHPQTAETGRR